MFEGRPRGRRCCAIGGVALAVVAAAGCDASTPAATAPSAPASSGIVKPADARQAVLDAVQRTATFKDVKYDLTTTTVTGPSTTSTSGTVASTSSPPVTDRKTAGAAPGSTQELILNLAAGVECFLPASGERVRTTFKAPASPSTDPFNRLKTDASGWIYAANLSLNGHSDWHLTGKLPGGTGFTDVTKQVLSLEVDINPATGKIERDTLHETDTLKSGSLSETTAVSSNFVYDQGVTIAACQ
jgi:hypothetical protein